jgi:hypothetical protein
MPHKILAFTAFVFATLPLVLASNGGGFVIAGTSTPNVAGTWEGTWSHRVGSGRITLHLAQEGNHVTGKQSVVGVFPMFKVQRQIKLGEEIREGPWRTPR